MSGELHVRVHDCATWTSSDEFGSWEPTFVCMEPRC